MGSKTKQGKSFIESEKEFANYDNSKFIVIPCPHEATTSYAKGTKNGPKAIIDASFFLENFDDELLLETYKDGIHTTSPITISKLKLQTSKTLNDKKIPIILGGEHSISPVPISAAKIFYPDLTVLQFDAHADLRDKYNGQKSSHACAARRILEICPIVQVGIRNISREEWEFAKGSRQLDKIYFKNSKSKNPALPAGRQNSNEIPNPNLKIQKILNQLSDNVYITFDVDVFDPSIMPSTGTPEPGGMLWDEVLDILRAVCANKNIVGADFVELMPIKGLHAPDYMIAKLIYRLMGYITQK